MRKQGGHKDIKQGFTIVELLIVIVVIAILAAITIVAYNGIQQQSRASALQSELTQTAKVLETEKIKNPGGAYAASLSDVGATSPKLTYHYNQRANSFCIDAQDGSTQYSLASEDMTPAEGPCGERGLALWLPFNGNMNDTSGGEHVFTVSSAPTLTTGANGAANSAYAFDGVDDMIYTAGGQAPNRSDSFTVSSWVRGVGTPASDFTTYLHNSSANSIGSSMYWIGANQSGAITISVNGQYTTGSTGIIANTTDWRHVVLVFAGGRQTGYVDGVQRVDSNVGTITNNTTSIRLSIGASYNSGYRDVQGSIDDVRIYNRALSATEVTALFNAGAQ